MSMFSSPSLDFSRARYANAPRGPAHKGQIELQTTQRAASIRPQSVGLSEAVSQRAPQRALGPLDTQLQSEKEKHEKIMRELNGRYYEDPHSLLKQAWDTLFEKVPLATGQPVAGRSTLNDCLQTLEGVQTTTSMEAKSSIHNYLLLEMKRDTSEAIFKKITSIQKNERATLPLLAKQEELQRRLKELCGDYYEDPASLLDLAWREYKQAREASSPDAGTLLNTYSALEEERKTTEAELYYLQQQLSLSATPNNETLTSLLAIRGQIEKLEGSTEEQDLLAGRVDWKQTAIKASRQALLTVAGHLVGRF